MMSAEPIQMIFGGLQAFEIPARNGVEFIDENLAIVKAICNRKDLNEMEIHQQAIIFAEVSRFIASQNT